MKQKGFVSFVSIALALVLALPTTAILATWNTLPGEPLYGVKRGLEDIAVTITTQTPIGTALAVGLTERRFNEATTLLDEQGATTGFGLLLSQAEQAQQRVVETRDTKKAAELLSNLTKYQEALEKKQEALAKVQQEEIAQGIRPLPSPASETAKVVTTTIAQTINDIDFTQQTLGEIIREVARELPDVAQDIPIPTSLPTPPVSPGPNLRPSLTPHPTGKPANLPNQ